MESHIIHSTIPLNLALLFAEISPKGKRKLDFPKKNKSSIKLPLTGKTLYLDVKDAKCTRRLQADLKKLGGVSLFVHVSIVNILSSISSQNNCADKSYLSYSYFNKFMLGLIKPEDQWP